MTGPFHFQPHQKLNCNDRLTDPKCQHNATADAKENQPENYRQRVEEPISQTV